MAIRAVAVSGLRKILKTRAGPGSASNTPISKVKKGLRSRNQWPAAEEVEINRAGFLLPLDSAAMSGILIWTTVVVVSPGGFGEKTDE